MEIFGKIPKVRLQKQVLLLTYIETSFLCFISKNRKTFGLLGVKVYFQNCCNKNIKLGIFQKKEVFKFLSLK